MKIKILLLCLVAMFLYACSDNLFEGLADDDTSDAKADKLENALNDGDYGYIIGQHRSALENALNDGDYGYIIGQLDPGDCGTLTPAECFSGLSDRELYALQMAYMGAAGFDLLDNLDKFLEDNDSNMSSTLMSSLFKGDSATVDDIDNMSVYYKRAADIASANPNNENTAFAGGVAAAADVLMVIAGAAATENGGTVSFDENNTDGNYFMDVIGDMDGTAVEQMVASADLANKVDERTTAISNGINTLVDDGDNDVRDKFNDYLDQITGGGGSASNSSVSSFIQNELSRAPEDRPSANPTPTAWGI